jgi:hypothetical protein
MKKILGVLTILIFAGCAVHLMEPVDADAVRGGEKFPGITLDELQHGKFLYERHCEQCHRLKKPASRNEDGWNKIMPKMALKAKIDVPTKDLILKYLITMSTVPKK